MIVVYLCNIKMQNFEDQYTLFAYPAFQPLVIQFIQQQKVMEMRAIPLETLLANLNFKD
jgi:hypothetical protein